MTDPKPVIGRAELLDFPELGLHGVAARIDTGAKTSAIWATNIKIDVAGMLTFCLLGKSHKLYTGKMIKTDKYETRVVASSTGHQQERYFVRLLVTISGRKIRATFSLADRSTQAYPVLVGRNILQGKFIVDVAEGSPDYRSECYRTNQLQQPKSEGSQS